MNGVANSRSPRVNAVTAIPFSIAGTEPALPDAVREQLLALAATHSPALVAVFDAANGRVVYLNDAGRRWLASEPNAKLEAFTLPEVFGVRSLDLLNNTILPHAHVLGVWRGQCELRDAWGSETAVEMTVLKRAVAGRSFHCVIATRRAGTPAEHNAYDRELLQALLEAVHDQVYFKDRKSRFLRTSASMRGTTA